MADYKKVAEWMLSQFKGRMLYQAGQKPEKPQTGLPLT